MKNNDSTTSTCNSLLRGELSAIETYTHAQEKFPDHSGGDILKCICASHQTSATALRDLIDASGDKAVTSSGPWGTFATAVEGMASLFGESPALLILQHGEVHGISEYEKALEDKDLHESLKHLIRTELLPALRDHLVELEHCKSMVA